MVRHRTWSLVVATLLIASLTTTAAVGAAEQSTDEAFFEVEITGTNAPVVEGETLVVNATVTNTGGAEGSQQIHLKDSDWEVVDSVASPPLTLAPGESENVTLRWQTGQGDAEADRISVQSNDHFPRHDVEIQPSAFFEITIEDTNAPIMAGDELSVTVNATNTGGAAGTTPVWLAYDGERVDTSVLYLEPGQTSELRMTWHSDETDSGVQILTAGITGDEDRKPVTVRRAVQSTNDGTESTETDSSGTESVETESDEPTSETPTETEAAEQLADASTEGSDTATPPSTEATPGSADDGGVGFGAIGALLAVIVGALVAFRLGT